MPPALSFTGAGTRPADRIRSQVARETPIRDAAASASSSSAMPRRDRGPDAAKKPRQIVQRRRPILHRGVLARLTVQFFIVL